MACNSGEPYTPRNVASVTALRTCLNPSHQVVIQLDADPFERKQWIVGRDRLALGPDRLSQAVDRRHHGILVGKHHEAQPMRVHLAHQCGRRLGAHRLHQRLCERPIETVIDLREPGEGSEALVILVTVGTECADVVQRTRLERQQILSVYQVGPLGPRLDLPDHGLVQAGGHHIDHFDARGELGMLLGRHLARNEDAEMTDRLVQRVDDGLAVGDDLAVLAVEVGDPAQRLLGGVMSSPHEQNTMIGDLMLRRSTRKTGGATMPG